MSCFQCSFLIGSKQQSTSEMPQSIFLDFKIVYNFESDNPINSNKSFCHYFRREAYNKKRVVNKGYFCFNPELCKMFINMSTL